MVGLWRWNYSVKLLIYSLDEWGSWDAINYLSPRICLIGSTWLASSLWSHTIAGSFQFTIFLKIMYIKYLLFADRLSKQFLQFIPSNTQVLVNPENQLFGSDNSAVVYLVLLLLLSLSCYCTLTCAASASTDPHPHREVFFHLAHKEEENREISLTNKSDHSSLCPKTKPIYKGIALPQDIGQCKLQLVRIPQEHLYQQTLNI